MPAVSFSQTGILLLTAVSTISALPYLDLDTRQGTPCQAVHIFLAKGGNEPYPGRQGKLAGAVCYGIDSCDYEDIQYYNPEGSDYCAGVSEGNRNGLAQMTAYADRCPNAKLVLSGYSQGANVVGDLLGGGGGVIFDECTVDASPALDRSKSPGNKLAAVVLFGDVRHAANQPFNVLNGSAFDSGSSTRTDDSLELMNEYSYIMRSYCDGGDPICATSTGGPYVIANHLNYFDLYSDDAAEWVKSLLKDDGVAITAKA